MATSIVSQLRTAIVAIVEGDNVATIGLHALMGRATNLIVTWKGLRPDGAFPVLVYELTGFGQTGRKGDSRDGMLRVTAFAQGNNALTTAEAIIARCQELFTEPAFQANGIDAAPWRLSEDSDDDSGDEFDADLREGSRNLERADLEIELTLTTA